jgi:Raf kinase inhibitor-like YbhB/YbcL family protein
MRASILSVLVLAAAPTAVFAHGKTQTLQVSSTEFTSNGDIPTDYTCEGSNISPPLTWSDVPSGTKSIAILVEDPDAPKGTFTHWLVTGIAPTTTSIGKEGNLPAGAVAMKNDKGETGYSGPCPPNGKHHYHFRVFALDTAKVKAASRTEFLSAIKGHTLASGDLVGTYEKQKR